MEKAAPPDTLAVAGDQLKQAREARGMSVNDMAGALTLSREQVRALEDGGNLPFYTAAHKRLALKKYAAALGIPLSDLIIDTPGETAAGAASTAPLAPLPGAAAADAPAELRLAAAERNARARRKLLVAAVAGAILLALYAKQRGTIEAEPPPEAIEAKVEQQAPATEPPTALLVAAPEPDALAATPAGAAPPVAAAAVANEAACTLPAATEVQAWSPPYQRKPDTRVFFVSGKAVDVCIADASGKPSLISLKPNSGQAFAGKPPYLVHADGLASIDIYLQGMRARVPADARSLRLVPTAVMPPTEVADSRPTE